MKVKCDRMKPPSMASFCSHNASFCFCAGDQTRGVVPGGDGPRVTCSEMVLADLGSAGNCKAPFRSV